MTIEVRQNGTGEKSNAHTNFQISRTIQSDLLKQQNDNFEHFFFFLIQHTTRVDPSSRPSLSPAVRPFSNPSVRCTGGQPIQLCSRLSSEFYDLNIHDKCHENEISAAYEIFDYSQEQFYKVAALEFQLWRNWNYRRKKKMPRKTTSQNSSSHGCFNSSLYFKTFDQFCSACAAHQHFLLPNARTKTCPEIRWLGAWK